MQSLELVKSSELIMVFRISKIHTNADFTFSNNNLLKVFLINVDILLMYVNKLDKFLTSVYSI